MRALPLISVILLFACPAQKPAPVVPVALDVAADGAFSVTRAGAGLQSLRASVVVSGTELALSGTPTITSADREDALGKATETTLEQTSGSTRLVLVLRKYETFVTAKLTASCAGSCAGVRVEGFTLAGQPSSAPTSALVNGYSSWAPTYYATVQRDEPGDAAAFTGNNQNALSSDARLSWWVSALVLKDSAFAAGALTAETWKTRVLTWRAADGVQVRVKNGGGGDSLPLTAEGVGSETIFFTGDASLSGALGAWAKAVATVTPPPDVPFVPVGWNSWNTLFEGVTHDNALANADRMVAMGYRTNNVQLDDGWEQAWGTWSANAKFPAGMDGFATQLRAKQLNAGVWMAPFFVDESTPIAVAHRDWFVKDPMGRLIAQNDFFTGHTYNAIDASNPEARAWMVGEVKRLITQGYRYLKLDFLYAGAYEGVRQRDVTSIQSFRLAMKEIMTEAQAAGAYVVACGAPVLPSAGVAHALRTSNDIAARGTPYTFEWVKNMSRNVGARWFVNPFLANDPDTILIRTLPDGVKRQQVTTTLLAGRLLGLGDDLTAASADERAFLEKVATLPSIATVADPGPGFVTIDAEKPRTSPLSQAEALVDAESYGVPSIWAARGTSEGALIGVFNWTNAEQTFSLDAARLGLDGTENAEDLWRGAKLSFANGAWAVTLPARDAAYVRIAR